MYGIHIVATGRAVPARSVSNEELSKWVDTSDEWITTRTGIKNRYFCEGETCISLACMAAQKAIDKVKINVCDIGTVVVATSTNDYAFPSAACMVTKALGLEKDTMAFDISAACSGFLYGINICRSLLVTGNKKYALLIGSEQMSRILDFDDRTTCVLFGDGAGACIIELSDSKFNYNAWTNGCDSVLSCKGAGYADSYIKMNGSEVFKFAVNAIKEGINTALNNTVLSMDDIDYVICHQANERIISHVGREYRCMDKFYMNMSEYANTSAASIPIALDEMYEKGMLKTGMKVILAGFGAGLTYSSALITI